MLARQRAAVRRRPARAASSRKVAEPRRPPGLVERRSRCGRARSRRRSGRRARPSTPCARQQRRRSRAGSAPSRSGGTAASSQPGVRRAGRRLRAGQAGAVLADPPQRGLVRGVGRPPGVQRGRGVDEPPPAPARSPRSAAPASSTNSQPAPRGSGGHAAGATPGAHHVDDPRVEPLAGDRPGAAAAPGTASAAAAIAGSRARPAAGSGASRTSRTVARASPRGCPRVPTRTGRASKPCSGSRCSQGVAGDLAAEPAELGADRGQVRGDHLARARSRRPTGRGAAAPGGQPLAGAGDARRGRPRCRRCGRSRGPASRRRCCRSSRRACSGCASTGRARTAARAARPRCCRSACTTPGSTTAVARLGVDRRRPGRGGGRSPARCPAPTALPAIDVPAPRGVSGTPVARARRPAPRAPRRRARGRTTACGTHAVERRVGGVLARAGVESSTSPTPAARSGGRDVARPRCAHHRDREARRISAASSAVTSRGAVASSRCCLSAPSTRSSTSPSS